MKIKQQKIPIQLRRIAAMHLESIRDTEMALNTQDLYLSDMVVPIYRPDLKEPAYFEFHILQASRKNVDDREDLTEGINKINLYSELGLREIYGTRDSILSLQPKYTRQFEHGVQGFIIVSSGPHDFPITHWSLESAPPSVLLEQMAAEKSSELAKVYKIDALSYVGEDERGREVASLGQKPMLIQGLEGDLSEHAGRISSFEMERKAVRSQNDSIKVRQGRGIQRGPKPKDYQFVSADWERVKKNFEESFKPFMQQLEISASEVWEKERMIEALGEGILAGEQFFIPLLEQRFAVELHGEASEFTVLRIVQRPNDLSAIELTTERLPASREMDLFVQIQYEGSEERIHLFVVNPDSPTETINNLKNEEE